MPLTEFIKNLSLDFMMSCVTSILFFSFKLELLFGNSSIVNTVSNFE